MQNSVCLDYEPSKPGCLQDWFEFRRISAFRQPNSPRFTTKAASIMITGDKNLSTERRWMLGQQWQQCVRRGAGDDFQTFPVLELTKRANQVLMAQMVECTNGQ